jgi:hypothetical protein
MSSIFCLLRSTWTATWQRIPNANSVQNLAATRREVYGDVLETDQDGQDGSHKSRQ